MTGIFNSDTFKDSYESSTSSKGNLQCWARNRNNPVKNYQSNQLFDRSKLAMNLQTGSIWDIRHSLSNITALKALGWSSSISIRQGYSELLKTIPS